MVKIQRIGALVTTAAVILFYYFVYPTPYYYSSANGVAYRTQRYTGKRFVSTKDGWVPVEQLQTKGGKSAQGKSAVQERERIDIRAAWKTVDFDSALGKVGQIVAHNPSPYPFTLKIDAPVEYFLLDDSGKPVKKIFSGTGVVSQEIAPKADTKLSLTVNDQTGYPDEVLDAAQPGDKVLQRVTVSPASALASNGQQAPLVGSDLAYTIERTFTPYR